MNESCVNTYMHAARGGSNEQDVVRDATDSGRVVWAHEVSHRTKVVGIRKTPEQIAIYGLP